MIDLAELYPLPWTREDNPNGWIEPTTLCQLKCPLCYRGVDLDGHAPAHTPIVDVRREIDELVQRRRVSTITIAGGEPLLYPQLEEMITYARWRGAEVMLLTNGIALDEAMLRRLKVLDVARIMIHIDKYQGRPGISTEAETIPLRRSFCELFRRVGGVSLGFIQPLGHDDLGDLDVLLPFYKRNADVVDLVTFNRMQPVVDFDRLPDERILDGTVLFERVREVYGFEWGAYLGRTHTPGISWLFGHGVFAGDRLVGFLDKGAFRFIQEDHRRRTGQYRHCSRESAFSLRLLGYIPFNRSLRRIAWARLRLIGRARLHHQLVLIVNTPRRFPDGTLDRCKGCPDAMLHQGRLVPSCLLEQVKAGAMIEAG